MKRISERVNIAACLGLALLILLPVGRAEGASDNASKLLDLATKKFPSLTFTKAEKNLFQAVVNGETADCSDRLEKNNDPNMAKDWDEDTRVIRAKCLYWLITDREASAMVTHKGIRVKGARIDGQVNLAYARISFPLHFEKSAFPGGINLRHAEIRQLFLIGTHTGPINGDGAKIEGDVFLRNGFKAEGGVRLLGASIGGDLDCEKGEFINKGAKALYADSIDVKGNVFLRNGFHADGKVDLFGATIDKYFVWKNVNSPEEITLDLRSVRIGTLYDDAKSWPNSNKLFLHGLVYNEIDDDAPRDAERRIGWLRRQPGFQPQPYEQLAAVLRKSGQDDDAKKILIAKNEDRAQLTKLTWSEKCWYRVLGPMIGYGYRPLNALWGVVALVGLGWVLFGIGYWGGLVTPQNQSAYVKRSVSTVDGDAEVRELSDVYPRFNFLVYSVDVFVPLIDLHQAKYWLPNASRGAKVLNIKGFALHTGGLLRLYLWVHITMGWAITMLLVAGLTGLIRT